MTRTRRLLLVVDAPSLLQRNHHARSHTGLRDRQGRLYVLEVNSIPAWKGLQGVTELDIAQLLVDDFIARMQPASRLVAVS